MKNISAIIPTYNRAHCIGEAINSILVQTYPVSEIIIADDCSTDNTEEVIREMNNPIIKYVRLPNNMGAGGARNYGVSRASGEYIAFLDSDDRWTSDKISKQIKYYELHPEVGLVYSRYLFHKNDGSDIEVPEIKDLSVLEGDIITDLFLRNKIGAPTVMIKKSIFEETGGFDEEMDSLEDWDFAIKVALKYPIGFVNETLLDVTQSGGGVSSSVTNHFVNRCKIIGRYKEDLIRLGKLDEAMLNTLKLAEQADVLEPVKKMIMAYLL